MVRFGFQLPFFEFQNPSENLFDDVKKFAVEAESLGFDSFWLMDHVMQIPFVTSNLSSPIMEPYTTLSALAPCTKKIKLGPLVTCNLFRYPSLLAKMTATLDVISGGRLFLGIGAGWFQQECEAYGIPFPTTRERMDRLEEALQILKLMWTQERPSVQGKYYTLKEAICNPKPIQKPHPPILIGGGGEKRILGMVAKYGNACNLFGDAETVRRKLAVLADHCRKHQRSTDEILKTTLSSVVIAETDEIAEQRLRESRPHAISEDDYRKVVFAGTPNACVEKFQGLREAGADYFIVNFPGPNSLDNLTLFAKEVFPAFKD